MCLLFVKHSGDEEIRNNLLVHISHSSQCSMTGVTNAMVCAILSGMVHIKEPLLLIERIDSVVAAAGFLSCYLNGLLSYIQCHIMALKMC